MTVWLSEWIEEVSVYTHGLILQFTQVRALRLLLACNERKQTFHETVGKNCCCAQNTEILRNEKWKSEFWQRGWDTILTLASS